ncbi:GntR family transcriptional regulator [Pseudoclavibacter chungangensis]|uniref:GntR family transcriptional regulator n=1 Tax=Pseudoclavibacter chungangensis TaxID=587635 RepID=A0A7J5BQ46_9MICO|nr:GntR family transcriptional regulator [Pseudoclavibacter chungangensis]KAB1655631.1 GntR family transcriptional regulator [Pseudoclavibacter chungangensis]NYJ67968.1 DNA-binding GntR family transcriptional regulator [Pseudoclavibacter chungangensis]
MRASDRVYALLRDEILDGDLAPGTVLAEVAEATRLGVSRTPVREALSRLVADGLVHAQSPRVLVVTEVSAERIEWLYELRQALEARAAASAARRRDPAPFVALRERLVAAPALLELGGDGVERYFALIDDLDAAIDTAVANPYLQTALRSARLHSARVRRLAEHDHARLRAAADEHRLIVDAIIAGDAELAADATRVHLHRSLRRALATTPRVDERTSA